MSADSKNNQERLPELDDVRLPKLEAAYAGMLDRFPIELVKHYPGIVQQINALWGSRKTTKFLAGLKMNKAMFVPEVAEKILEEISDLQQKHAELLTIRSVFTDSQTHSSAVDKINAHKKTEELPGAKGESSGSGDRPVLPDNGDWPEITGQNELNDYALKRLCNGIHSVRDQRRLGEILVKYDVIKPDALARAVEEAVVIHEPLGRFLVEQGLLKNEDLIRALCVQDGIPSVNLSNVAISREAMEKITLPVARAKRVAPIALLGKMLFLAVEDPTSFVEKPFFSFMTSCHIELMHASRTDIENALSKYEPVAEDALPENAERSGSLVEKLIDALPAPVADPLSLTVDLDGGSSAEQLIDGIITDALHDGASSIHIESWSFKPQVQVRFRRSGRMTDHSAYPIDDHRLLLEKIKSMASLNVAIKGRPQTGKIEWDKPGSLRRSLRVSIIPTYDGCETVTIDFLSASEIIPLEQLGLSAVNYKLLRAAFRQFKGMILVGGPSRTDRIMTLYSMVDHLNDGSRKIWTIEDPVELAISGVSQLQVEPATGWTYAAALSAIARTDADVVAIDEIDDDQSLHLAAKHAQGGALVLYTLNTLSASNALARLSPPARVPFDMISNLTAILVQRTVARVCSCGQLRKLEETELENLASEWCRSSEGRLPLYEERQQTVERWKEAFGNQGTMSVKIPQGCPVCQGRGFKGQLGVFELLPITPDIRNCFNRSGSEAEFLQIATRQGMKTLRQDGMEKVFRGLTTFEQIRNVCL